MTATFKTERRRPIIKEQSRAYFAALGKHITLLRKARDMTQAELARALGVSQQAVFVYEIGDRRVSVLVLKKIAQLSLTSMDDLAGMAAPRPAPKNRRLSPKAMRHAERMSNLSKTAQRFFIRILDCLEDGGHIKLSSSESNDSPAEKHSHAPNDGQQYRGGKIKPPSTSRGSARRSAC